MNTSYIYYLEILTPETVKLLGSTKSKITKNEHGENMSYLEITEAVLTQPARNVLGTSPEGPLKVLTSRTSRGPSGDSYGTNTKIDDLMKKVFFRSNSPCFTHLLLFLLEKQIFRSSRWRRLLDVYRT